MTEIKETRRIEEDGYDSISFDIISGGDVVGAISVSVSSTGAYCERIDVDEDFRNQGIGTAALNLLSSEFGSVIVAPDNADAQRLYERIGYDVTNKDDNWSVDQGFGVYEIQ